MSDTHYNFYPHKEDEERKKMSDDPEWETDTTNCSNCGHSDMVHTAPYQFSIIELEEQDFKCGKCSCEKFEDEKEVRA